jgi:hypothetical protein
MTLVNWAYIGPTLVAAAPATPACRRLAARAPPKGQQQSEAPTLFIGLLAILLESVLRGSRKQ